MTAVLLWLILLHPQERIDIVNELPQVYPYFFIKPDLTTEEAVALHKKIDSRALRTPQLPEATQINPADTLLHRQCTRRDYKSCVHADRAVDA